MILRPPVSPHRHLASGRSRVFQRPPDGALVSNRPELPRLTKPVENRRSTRSACPAERKTCGLTITELLVAVSIMTVLVFGLYSMFSHTQRAMRASMTQVDVLENGRTVLELLTSDLAEVAALNLSNRANLRVARTYAAPKLSGLIAPIRQLDAAENNVLRTNVIQEFYFLTTQTNVWTAVGYRVMDAVDGVGTLYRFSASARLSELAEDERTGRTDRLLDQFDASYYDASGRVVSDLHRVANGLIHLKLTAYDRNGLPLDLRSTHRAFVTQYVNEVLGPTARFGLPGPAVLQVRPDAALPVMNHTEFLFRRHALPSYLELELGILEPETYQQFLSVRGTDLAQSFLRKRANRVHLFRQRIPIRTAAP